MSVLFATAVEIAFLVFLTRFIWNHANPLGDGMEMVLVGMAIMFIFLPFTLPALVLAARDGVQYGDGSGARASWL